MVSAVAESAGTLPKLQLCALGPGEDTTSQILQKEGRVTQSSCNLILRALWAAVQHEGNNELRDLCRVIVDLVDGRLYPEDQRKFGRAVKAEGVDMAFVRARLEGK